MKRSIRVLLGIASLLIVVAAVTALSHVDVITAIEMAKDNIIYLAAPAAIVSSSITPELIKNMQLKYGKIKVITVIVEPAVYDIDELTPKDKANLRILGIDVSIICNRELDLEDRLAPIFEFKTLLKSGKIDSEKMKIADLIPDLSGEVISEAEQYQFLVRRPDRGLVKMLLPLAEQGKVDDFADRAVKNLVIEGDMQALDDGIVYMGVVSQLKEMIAPAQAFLANA